MSKPMPGIVTVTDDASQGRSRFPAPKSENWKLLVGSTHMSRAAVPSNSETSHAGQEVGQLPPRTPDGQLLL